MFLKDAAARTCEGDYKRVLGRVTVRRQVCGMVAAFTEPLPWATWGSAGALGTPQPGSQRS